MSSSNGQSLTNEPHRSGDSGLYLRARNVRPKNKSLCSGFDNPKPKELQYIYV